MFRIGSKLHTWSWMRQSSQLKMVENVSNTPDLWPLIAQLLTYNPQAAGIRDSR